MAGIAGRSRPTDRPTGLLLRGILFLFRGEERESGSSGMTDSRSTRAHGWPPPPPKGVSNRIDFRSCSPTDRRCRRSGKAFLNSSDRQNWSTSQVGPAMQFRIYGSCMAWTLLSHDLSVLMGQFQSPLFSPGPQPLHCPALGRRGNL